MAEVWKHELGARQRNVNLKVGAGLKFYSTDFEALMKKYNNPSSQLAEIFGDVEKLIYFQVLRAFYVCGWEPEVGKILEEDVLAKELRVHKEQQHYFSFMLETLEAEGVLLPSESNRKTWKIASIPPPLEHVNMSLKSRQFAVDLVEEFSPALIILKLGEHLSGIVRREESALRILFEKDESGRPLITDFYCEYPRVFLFSESFCIANRQRLAQLKDGMNGTRFILRALEIGAGTGGYSAQFLNCLDEEGIEFEYTYTDISAAFFPAAQKRFEKYGKQIIFKKLNIEEDPIDQGFTPEYYDFVYMAEVIHATRDIRESLKNIRMLMKPYGRIDMHEGTRKNRIITYIFGALEGFWRFTDFDLRPNHCILSLQKWAHVFEESGFNVDKIFPLHNDYHSHVWVHKTAATNIQLYSPSQLVRKKVWVVFYSEKMQVGTYLTTRIGEATNRRVITVVDGLKFEVNKERNAYKIRKEVEEDYASIFRSLKADNVHLEGIIYCWIPTHSEDSCTTCEIPCSLLLLTKSMRNAQLDCCPRLIWITNGVFSIGSTNVPNLDTSNICHFAQLLKNSNMDGIKILDVERGIGDFLKDSQLEEIYFELWNLDKDLMVAYREGTRYHNKLKLQTN